MKKWLLLCYAALFLSACMAAQPTQIKPSTLAESTPQVNEPAPSALAEQSPLAPTVTPVLISEESAAAPAAYTAALSAEQTIQAYFEQQYLSYINLSYTDISPLLDMEQAQNRNLVVWLQTLTQRRRLLTQHNLCYVETQKFPYTIQYLQNNELTDDRMNFWNNRGIVEESEDSATFHFVILGEKGKVYPPMMATGAEHTILMRKVNGVWKIYFHYYPGSVRRFYRSGEAVLPSEEEMLAELLKEFFPASVQAVSIPAGAKPYNGELAARYAQNYTETPNPGFYKISDWMGNCMNFVSQCVWYGFGSEQLTGPSGRQNMTAEWYAGGGGGSPAWENVDHFWRYATDSKGFLGQVLPGVSALREGDIVQTRSARPGSTNTEDYNHCLILMDKERLVLAQNSPACFLYYSDIVNVQYRFLRPVSLS